jgi:hypothetical protein
MRDRTDDLCDSIVHGVMELGAGLSTQRWPKI